MTVTRPPRTLGPGHDEFWAGCAEGELRLPRCTACAALQWPVAAACERCGNEGFRWETQSGRGTLVSWCRFHQDYYRGMIPVPYDTILVRLDNGPLFIANPDGFASETSRPGMDVQLAFRDGEDATGPFRLPVFTPRAKDEVHIDG